MVFLDTNYLGVILFVLYFFINFKIPTNYLQIMQSVEIQFQELLYL